MEIGNPDESKDITIVGYCYSGVEYLYKTISLLIGTRSPATTESHVRNIVCREGGVPTCYQDTHTHSTNKTIFIVRNPKDIAIAMYNNSGVDSSKEFSDFLNSFVFGESGEKWCDHTKQWENVLSRQPTSHLHLVYFDDLIQNSEAEVSRLCQFLNIQKSSCQISELCLLLSKEAEQPQRKRRKTNISVNGYREAFYKVGLWKNHFTVHLQEQFDSAVLNLLKDTKFDLSKLL